MIKFFRKKYSRCFVSKHYIFVLLFIAVLIILLYKTDNNTSANFRETYAIYATVAKKHEIVAYIPGIPENTVREELNQILSELLIKEMNVQERLTLSQDGLDLIKFSEKQIDAIGNTSVLVSNTLREMIKSASQINGFRPRDEAQEIINLAQARLDIISDLRGLLYRANYYTAEIFKRVVLDGGKLTDDHMLYLNQQISEAEKQFDARSLLYIKLKDINSQIEKKYVNFEKSL